jgi:hypothetical protein
MALGGGVISIELGAAASSSAIFSHHSSEQRGEGSSKMIN